MRLALAASSLLLLTASSAIPTDSCRSQASDPGGIKLTTRYTSSGLATEHTQYIQGDRRRMEYRNATGTGGHWFSRSHVRYGPRMALISRCDLRQDFELNLDAREYATAPMQQFRLQEAMEKLKEGAKRKPQPPKVDALPTYEIRTSTRDTGERKDFFGHTARHIITERKESPLEGSQQEPGETITDAWYIDLDTSLSCDPKVKATHAVLVGWAGTKDGTRPPVEIPRFIDEGEPATGLPVQMKITFRRLRRGVDGEKERVSTTESSVTELYEGPISSSLFEVPAGFKLVDRVHSEWTAAQRWNSILDALREEWNHIFI